MAAEPTRAFWNLQPAPPERPTWRCYFCDEVFTTPGEAGDHFGASLTDKPGCLIDYRVQVEAGTTTQRGRGLLMALRRAEAELARYREEDTDLHRAMHRMESEHRQALLREEEKGYARGLRDGVNLPADSPERAALVAAAPSAAAQSTKGGE